MIWCNLLSTEFENFFKSNVFTNTKIHFSIFATFIDMILDNIFVVLCISLNPKNVTTTP